MHNVNVSSKITANVRSSQDNTKSKKYKWFHLDVKGKENERSQSRVERCVRNAPEIKRRALHHEHYGRPFVSKLWHDIRAVFSYVYLQSFLLHDIRAFFCHVYLRFIPKYMTIFLQTRIYMRTKKPIYMRYKQACGIWGHRKSSYKRHRIIPSAKNSFMYDGAEK